jgi:hypothetical protein
MALLAGALEIQMSMGIARIQDDIRKAQSIVGSGMKSIESSVAMVKNALGALGIGLGVGYFVSLIKGSIDAADHLNDLRKTTDITVEKLAGLKLLAAQTGIDMDGLAKGINKMSVAMGTDPDKFVKLGVTAKGGTEALKQLADIFNLLPDINQRNALSQKIFSKSWAELAPALSEGGKRIGEIIEKGERLSAMTTSMAVNADEFNDQMAELTVTLGATTTKIVADMLPGMNDIAVAMSEAAKEGGLLQVILVAIGGAITNLLGMTERQKVTARLGEIADELKAARKRLEAGTLNPEGSNPHFFSFLIPDIKLGEDALSKLRATIDALEKEKARLAPPAPSAPVISDLQIWDELDAEFAASAKAAAFLDDGAAAKAAAALLKKQEDAYKALIKTIHEKLAVNALELQGGAKLTAGQVLAANAMVELRDGTLKLTEAKKLNLAVELERLITSDKLNAQEKESFDKRAKAEKDFNDLEEKNAAFLYQLGRERDNQLKAADDSIKQMEFETTLITKTNVERETAIYLRQSEINMIDAATIARGREAIAAKHVAEETKSSQVGFWQSVESAGHQAFLSIFDTSKSVLERIRDMLKTHLIDILYQVTIKKWLVNIAVGTSGAGVAQSAFGSTGGSGLSLLSSGASIASFASSAGWLGSAAAGGVPVTSTLGAVASGAGYVGAGSTGMMGTMGSAMAAIPGWGWAALGAAAIGAYILNSGNNEPPPGYRHENWAKLVENSSGFGFATSELPDPNAWAAYNKGANAALNDPTKYDPAVLRSMLGTSFTGAPGTGSEALIAGIMQQLSPAAQAVAVKAAEDLAAAESLAAQRRQLEIALMEVQGKATEALAAKREIELAALDPALRGLQNEIYAQQDMTKAANDAAISVQALADQFAALKSETISAVDAQISASQSVSGTAKAAAEAYRGITQALADAITRIRGGGTAGASGRLDALFGTAQTGDRAALQALPQAANDFLAASLTTSRTSLDYARDQARAINMLSAAGLTAGAAASVQDHIALVADAQLAVLTIIKDQLASPSPDASVLVEQARLLGDISKLSDSQLQQLVLSGGLQSDSLTALVVGNANIVSLLRQFVGMQNQQATSAWNDQFQAYSGGLYSSMKVPGQTFDLAAYGAAISAWRTAHPMPSYAVGTNYVPSTGPAMLHQGERVITAAANDALVVEIRSLRSEVAAMRRDTRKSADTLEGVANGQLSFSTVAA